VFKQVNTLTELMAVYHEKEPVFMKVSGEIVPCEWGTIENSPVNHVKKMVEKGKLFHTMRIKPTIDIY